MLSQMALNNNGSLVKTEHSLDVSNPASSSNDFSNDAEGVWSPDIDQAFHEALQIYPPCGRRKIILSDEGKMYGRNELIARYIKIRCGKTRTRKQVSSHIQVLARKKARENQAKVKQEIKLPEAAKRAAAEVIAGIEAGNMSKSASITPPHDYTSSKMLDIPIPIATANNPIFFPFNNISLPATGPQQPSGMNRITNPVSYLLDTIHGNEENFCSIPDDALKNRNLHNLKERIVASSKLVLCGFTAYIRETHGEHHGEQIDIVKINQVSDDPLESIKFDLIANKFPDEFRTLFENGPPDSFFLAKCWGNLAFNLPSEEKKANVIYAVDSFYDSLTKFDISVSTKAITFAKQIVEKVEVYSSIQKDNRYHFALESSPMCEYMVDFITKLIKDVNGNELKNRVLENFTVLQVIKNKHTNETIMAIAFMFEVSPDSEPTSRLYRLFVFILITFILFPLLSMLICQIIFNLDVDKRVFNHLPGECVLSKVFNNGLNNIVQVGDYVYFYTTGETNNSNINAYNDYNNQYFTFSLTFGNKKDNIVRSFSHLSIYKDNLFVVNEINSDINVVELFKIRFQEKVLKHVKTFRHSRFYNLQGLVAVGKESFYVVQQFYFKNYYLKALELIIGLPTGSVIYFNGLEAIPITGGIVSPKDLIINQKKTRIHVSSYGDRKIKNYRISKNYYNVSLLNDFTLGVSPVNILRYNNNDYIISTHPLRIHYLLTKFFKNDYLSPSQVIRMKWNKNDKKFVTEQLYANDGASMSAIENAVMFRESLLISNKKSAIQCSVNI
uniref:TEA domain-containing protein n=1 Tax=Parastrongyloides trichosuri TaxID=131310 RepID=A0A0N5A4B1_PARTI